MQFDKDISSQHSKLFLKVRNFMLENIDDVEEQYRENMTSYKTKLGMYCYLKVKDDYVHIGWGRGARLEDKCNILLGDGSIVRGQKIYSFDKQIKKILKDFINQTTIILIEHDEMKKLRKIMKNG